MPLVKNSSMVGWLLAVGGGLLGWLGADSAESLTSALGANAAMISSPAEQSGASVPAEKGVSVQAEAEKSTPAPIIWENEYLRYVVDPAGRNQSFFDKKAGKEQLILQRPSWLITIRKAGRDYTTTRCLWSEGKPTSQADRNPNLQANGKVTAQFEQAQAQVVLSVRVQPTYLVFEIESASEGVEEVRLLNLWLRPGAETSGIAGLAMDEQFAVVVRALNLKVMGHVGAQPSSVLAGLSGEKPAGATGVWEEKLPARIATLGATAYQKYGLSGAKLGLVACPTTEIRKLLQEMFEKENAVRSRLGGPWALDAPETRGSYVFATVSEADVDDWIKLAKQAGLAQIHLISWEKSLGHYEPRPDLFPNGIDGLKRVIDKIHAAGLKAGMHILTGCISPNDPWVTPTPDPRLAVDVRFTLAEPLDEKQDRIVTAERPENLDIIWAYASRGNVLRIGQELIQYSGLAQEPPYGFTGCRRGAFGTKPQAHQKGQPVEHLFVRYGCFLPDEHSSLVEEIAEAVGRVFNTCGFDMIYMDGAEGMPGDWYGISRMREAIYKRIQRPVLVEASCWDYHSWAFHSRLGAWDHPNWGLKPFVDLHCRSNLEYRKNTLLPVQLGWWAILGPSQDHDAELPDEFEYLCAKALAFDMPMSFQGISPGQKPWCARQEEYLQMLGRYERLRLSGQVPPAIRDRLKQEGQDFHLETKSDGSWQFRPADYLSHKVTTAIPETAAWIVQNRYAQQPIRLRIQALYSVEAYDSPKAIVLAPFAAEGEFGQPAAAPGVSAELKLTKEQVKVGAQSGQLTAKNQGSSARGAWARLTRQFDPPLNFGSCDALGVWVHGDGQGALVNLQLTNLPQFWPTHDEHYIKLDFTGWRYFEMPLRERDAEEYHKYVWPYGDFYAVYRSPLIRSHVSALHLYINEVPAKGSTTCLLSPIKVLPTVAVKLTNPTIELNGQRLVFPVNLQSGWYLEFYGQDEAVVFDQRGAVVQKVKPEGQTPILRSGENRLRFTCQGPEGLSHRAKITIITYGEPLGL
ncbi:MAG: hypothetical protein NZ602_10015 [Thermoguttaceae bacterium]|nr:hypothetical protein [Thermoguttaceae bacterium]MDW8038121.1 hypothetical protein [Thermoguttaceae bacterium]